MAAFGAGAEVFAAWRRRESGETADVQESELGMHSSLPVGAPPASKKTDSHLGIEGAVSLRRRDEREEEKSPARACGFSAEDSDSESDAGVPKRLRRQFGGGIAWQTGALCVLVLLLTVTGAAGAEGGVEGDAAAGRDMDGAGGNRSAGGQGAELAPRQAIDDWSPSQVPHAIRTPRGLTEFACAARLLSSYTSILGDI